MERLVSVNIRFKIFVMAFQSCKLFVTLEKRAPGSCEVLLYPSSICRHASLLNSYLIYIYIYFLFNLVHKIIISYKEKMEKWWFCGSHQMRIRFGTC